MIASKTKKRLLAGILLLAVLAGGYWTWKAKFAPKPDQYTTSEVARGNVTRVVSATGTIQAVNTVTVGSQVSGTIQRIYVDYNSPVKKGQLIAEIDPQLLSAQARQAEAELASSRANLAQAEAGLKQAQREHERQKELFAADFVAKSALDFAGHGPCPGRVGPCRDTVVPGLFKPATEQPGLHEDPFPGGRGRDGKGSERGADRGGQPVGPRALHHRRGPREDAGGSRR